MVAFDDNADPWAMGADQLIRVGTNEQSFVLSKTPTGVFANMKSIQVIEDGDIYLGVEAFFEKDNTKARIGYKVYKNNDYVDVDVTLFLGDIDKIIKLKVPVCMEGDFVGQTAFGTEVLFTNGRENVAQRFVAVENGKKALVLMNTGVYGNHFENGAIYMSLVRGATYCAHPIPSRQLLPTDRFTKKIDQGENTYSFRLGLVERRQLERVTQEFVQRPYGLNIFPIPTADTGASAFQVYLEDDTISLAVMKKADGREAIILRLFNNTEDHVTTVLHVNDASLPLKFGKYEVKTVLFEEQNLFESDEMII